MVVGAMVAGHTVLRNVKFSSAHNLICEVELLRVKKNQTYCSTYQGAYDAGIRIHPCGHISDLCKHKHTTLGADTPEHTEFCPLLPECGGRRSEDEALPELGLSRQKEQGETCGPSPLREQSACRFSFCRAGGGRRCTGIGTYIPIYSVSWVSSARVCFLSTKSRPRYFSRTSGSLASSSGVPCWRMAPS